MMLTFILKHSVTVVNPKIEINSNIFVNNFKNSQRTSILYVENALKKEIVDTKKA